MNMITLWMRLGAVNGSHSDNFLASDAQLVLLKFADGMVHAGDVESLYLRDFVLIMKELVKVRVPRLFGDSEGFSDAQVQCLTSSIRLLLDVFRFGLTDVQQLVRPPESTENVVLGEVLIGTISTWFVIDRRISRIITQTHPYSKFSQGRSHGVNPNATFDLQFVQGNEAR
jgi:hypothetical protein